MNFCKIRTYWSSVFVYSKEYGVQYCCMHYNRSLGLGSLSRCRHLLYLSPVVMGFTQATSPFFWGSSSAYIWWPGNFLLGDPGSLLSALTDCCRVPRLLIYSSMYFHQSFTSPSLLQGRLGPGQLSRDIHIQRPHFIFFMAGWAASSDFRG